MGRAVGVRVSRERSAVGAGHARPARVRQTGACGKAARRGQDPSLQDDDNGCFVGSGLDRSAGCVRQMAVSRKAAGRACPAPTRQQQKQGHRPLRAGVPASSCAILRLLKAHALHEPDKGGLTGGVLLKEPAFSKTWLNTVPISALTALLASCGFMWVPYFAISSSIQSAWTASVSPASRLVFGRCPARISAICAP